MPTLRKRFPSSTVRTSKAVRSASALRRNASPALVVVVAAVAAVVTVVVAAVAAAAVAVAAAVVAAAIVATAGDLTPQAARRASVARRAWPYFVAEAGLDHF